MAWKITTSRVALALCTIDLVAGHFLTYPSSHYDIVFQAYIATLALAGAVSNGSQRDRSIMTALFLWAAWVLITDQTPYATPPVYSTLESAAFTMLVFWAIVRPYTIPSHQYNPETVCLAFYHGDNAPLWSSLSALIGLPFASVAVLANGYALHPDRRAGLLVQSDADTVQRSGFYTIIDTGVEPGTLFCAAFDKAIGTSVKIGTLRIGCLKALRPVLNCINMAPTGIFQYIPSVFFYRALRVIK